MKLSEIQDELDIIVRDSYLKTKVLSWINDALLHMAESFDFPALQRLEPWPFTVNTSNWLYTAPENYLRSLFRCRDSENNAIRICTKFSELENQDPDHDETADHVTHIYADDASELKRLAIFPKADETIKLFFFEKPPYLSNPDETPWWIPAGYHAAVIVPLVVLRNYRHILSMVENPPDQGLTFWQAEYRKGLFGEPGGDIGMINYMARPVQPRRHGGRDPLP